MIIALKTDRNFILITKSDKTEYKFSKYNIIKEGDTSSIMSYT